MPLMISISSIGGQISKTTAFLGQLLVFCQALLPLSLGFFGVASATAAGGTPVRIALFAVTADGPLASALSTHISNPVSDTDH
jgi:hypothetical protein